MLYNIAKFILYLFFVIFRRVKIEGKENIPQEGPVLLFANHPSAWDMLLIAVFMKRRVHYMAKAELFKNPILGFIIRSLGAFPISRGKGDVGSVKTVFRLLEEGKIVGIFPEGTRTPKKDPNKRKAGAAMMALHSKAPVLPVGVEWNNKIFSKVRVVFGEPFLMLPKEEDKHIPREELLVLTNEILNKIYALIGQ
ncbi:MAG: 1-acyl-sn-glycerol-3-phosphate acyltransferase [Clostridiaceae bacterium]|jgi:1-acyl-sn-glycerol-3-phosphate acyltransferase|nr:1-acyl-sn-glycerol-3-phosphate acyltransferase [Clostridiaceae bacterium]